MKQDSYQTQIRALSAQVQSLSNQLDQTSQELSLVYRTSSAARITRQPREFFRQICLNLLGVLDVRAVGVVAAGESMLYGNLRIPATKLTRLANDLLDRFQQSSEPIVLQDLADAPSRWMLPHVHQLLAVPLRREDRFFGCMFAIDKPRDRFDAADSKLLSSIADQSAVFLENSLLLSDMKSLALGLVHSLTSAVDAKDSYTRGHSERVAHLAEVIARALGMDEESVQRIYLAGLLHDVGKIGISEFVLQKPGKLTSEEFEQMKTHPRIGHRILCDIPQVADILPGVLHHHEHFDGRGYPDQLQGKDIPLMARILSLADAFDAMTSDRTYREKLTAAQALEQIRECSGSQFDPEIVDRLGSIGLADTETLKAA